MKRRTLFTTLAMAAAALTLPLTATAREDFPKGSPKFEKHYKGALKDAQATGKPMVVVFSTSWCHYCQENKAKVYPSDVVKPFHEKFVWAYLDGDDKENEKLKKEFGVNGYPTILFLDKDAKVLEKLGGACPAASFAKTLESALKKAGTATPAAPATPAATPAKPAEAAKKPAAK